MEYLATAVFERTPAGAVAIKTPSDNLPRPLRSLLLAIDGRSPVSQYVPFLTGLTPLSEKFSQLEAMGFVRRRSQEASARSGAAPGPGALAPSPLPAEAANPSGERPNKQVTEEELRLFASSLAGQAMAAPTTPAPDPMAEQLRALAQLSRWNTVDAHHATSSTPSSMQFQSPAHVPATAHTRPALADLLHHMQAYLSDAAGMEGLPVAMMLEQIKSLAQLRQELPSYAALVTSYGGSAAAHIASLTRLLEQAEG